MKVMRKIVEIDEELCDGCGNCVPACAEGALVIENGKARVVKDQFCDGLGACLGDCPTGALRIVEREADEFDETAVEEYLSDKEKGRRDGDFIQTGCPSARIQTFDIPRSEKTMETGHMTPESKSSLGHWPVQIMLVPAKAPFLKGADLLVVADCAPLAYADFHRDFLKGKAVMMGCPKFDNVEAYIDKFAQICQNAGLKSITSVIMEVPCCSALPMIVRKGFEKAGKQIPMEEVVISTKGKILETRKVV
ncbi:MAG: 4Fe-4S binding protein [Desulfobacterales bacterium]